MKSSLGCRPSGELVYSLSAVRPPLRLGTTDKTGAEALQSLPSVSDAACTAGTAAGSPSIAAVILRAFRIPGTSPPAGVGVVPAPTGLAARSGEASFANPLPGPQAGP